MDFRSRRILPCLAAALVGASAFSSAAMATERRDPPTSSSSSGGEVRERSGRITALMQRAISRATKQMRDEVKSLKSASEELVDSLCDDPALADIANMTDDDLAAFIDGTLAEIDALVAQAKSDILKAKDQAAASLTKRKAPPGAFRRLEQSASNTLAMCDRAGERAADKLDRKLADLLAVSDCDDDCHDCDDSDDDPSSGSGSSSGGSPS